MADHVGAARPPRALFAVASEQPKDDEPGTLPMTSGRDNTAWVELARGLVNQALAALKAAEAGKSDGTGVAARI